MDEYEEHEKSYIRNSVIITKHPGKPLKGNVISVSSHGKPDTHIDGELLGRLVNRAEELYDIESYATDLRVGIVYFDADTLDEVGVSWEDSPKPYAHGDLVTQVHQLPDDLVPPEDLPRYEEL